MLAQGLFLAAAVAGGWRLEMPAQLVIEPPTAWELAGGAAVVWDGGQVPPLRPVVRRLTGAFRVQLPPGIRGDALLVEAHVLTGKGRPGYPQNAVRVVDSTLRLVEEGPEGSLWEGDVLVMLDVGTAEAGVFQGTLQVSVSAR